MTTSPVDPGSPSVGPSASAGAADSPAGAELLAELAGILRVATGEDDRWAAGIAPATLLEDDLQLDSLELATVATLLRQRFGDRVDLAGFVAGLGIDELIGLRVGDVLAYLSPRSAGRR